MFLLSDEILASARGSGLAKPEIFQQSIARKCCGVFFQKIISILILGPLTQILTMKQKEMVMFFIIIPYIPTNWEWLSLPKGLDIYLTS